jgi:GT2 family glycosyltransferase
VKVEAEVGVSLVQQADNGVTPTETQDTWPAEAKLPGVEIVVLNYNGKALAERCLQSIAESPYANKEVILVDNGSTDGSVEYLRSRFPGVVVLQNVENLGIAGGRNRGFIEAIRRGAGYVLSLDNDTRIDPKMIQALVTAAESDSHIGIVGPKTYMDDDSGRMQCAGGTITYTQNVCSERGRDEIDRGQYGRAQDVDYFPGFGFMARREVFQKLNFLDERFYGYGHEDTDFCVRAAKLGYRVMYVPDAVMWHRGSATIGHYSPRKKYLEAVNSVYFVRKYAGRTQRIKYTFFAVFGLLYALIVQSLRGNHMAVLAKAQGLWDGLRKPTA